MSEIEKIQRYIERTNIAQNTKSKYALSCMELLDLTDMPFPIAITTAFKYGRAKGYRAAKAEAAR